MRQRPGASPYSRPPPTATPEPAPSTEQPAVNLSAFVVTPVSTGRDVLEHVSEAESECIRSEIGDASYDAMLNAGLLAVGRGSDAVQTVFTCLNPDNFVLFSTAVIDAQNGGLDDATRACILDLGRNHEPRLWR